MKSNEETSLKRIYFLLHQLSLETQGQKQVIWLVHNIASDAITEFKNNK